MTNALIKHFLRYEYLISNDAITSVKTKVHVEITSAFSSSLRISINQKKKKKRLRVRNWSIFEIFWSSAHHYYHKMYQMVWRIQ